MVVISIAMYLNACKCNTMRKGSMLMTTIDMLDMKDKKA